MKIVCDNRIPFLEGTFDECADVVYLPGAQTGPADVKDADALITRTRTRCDATLLEGSSVKVIATATIGYDHIDTAWCESNGIIWSNAPGCNSSSVAQYIASVLVTLARDKKLDLPSLTLGVVGVGNVGSKVVRVANALGMKVVMCDPPRRRAEGEGQFTDLDTLVRESDIITLHVPLQKDGQDCTWHLFDSERFSSMRSDQILINSSRGPVVDNSALLDALMGGRIRAAVLDVWENEPTPDPELLALLDIATPHIAGYSLDGKARGTEAAVRIVSKVLGLPFSDWSVGRIPSPPRGLEFVLDAAGRSRQDVLTEALLRTYEVEEDSLVLISDPEGFERQRGNYPVRREPSAYTLYLQHGYPSLKDSLEELGFKVIC